MKSNLQTLLALSLSALCAAAAPPDYVEGEVLVLYKVSPSVRVADAAATNRTGQSRITFSQLSKRTGKKMQLVRDSSKTTAQLMASLRSDPQVQAVSPNYIKRIYAPVREPNDTYFANQWGLYNNGQYIYGITGNDDADIDYTDARRLMLDNPPDAVIAVLDTGVDYNHSDLQSAMWINTGEVPGNSIDDDGNGYIDDIYGYDCAGDLYPDPNSSASLNDGPDGDPDDVDIYPGHGTHVAGIAAAAANNARGIAGVGNLKVMALKVSEDGEYMTDSAILSATDYLLEMKSRGVNIVVANASYGGNSYNALEKLSIEELRDAGIVLCAAAGNATNNNDSTPEYPANYDVGNIISVAATDSSDILAPYSNYGQTSVDLAAPGSLILSTIPSHLAPASSVEQGAQTFSAEGMTFSGMTDSNGLTGILYNCGLGYPSDFPTGVAGNIALIERGDLYFSEKIKNAMTAGAKAAIIYNAAGETGLVEGTLGRPKKWIPSVGISRTDGLTLLSFTGQNITVINQQNEAGSYYYMNGTSMAAPMVAGAIGVLAQHFPDDTVTERIARLLNNVDPVTALSTNCATGGRMNLRNSLDSDNDDLPDWWELEYAGTLTAMNGTSDLDGDFMTDLNEYRTATRPDQPASKWTVAIKKPTINSESLQLKWNSQTGITYRVLASADLQTPFSLIREGLSATPPLNTWEAAATNSPSGFFKIEFTWE